MACELIGILIVAALSCQEEASLDALKQVWRVIQEDRGILMSSTSC